jgi:hypothetical protein
MENFYKNVGSGLALAFLSIFPFALIVIAGHYVLDWPLEGEGNAQYFRGFMLGAFIAGCMARPMLEREKKGSG